MNHLYVFYFRLLNTNILINSLTYSLITHHLLLLFSSFFLGFEWLVVTTTTQCFIYSLSNLNTPTIFEIKAPPHFLHLCKKSFLTLDQVSGLQIISYEGRVICSPRFQGDFY